MLPINVPPVGTGAQGAAPGYSGLLPADSSVFRLVSARAAPTRSPNPTLIQVTGLNNTSTTAFSVGAPTFSGSRPRESSPSRMLGQGSVALLEAVAPHTGRNSSLARQSAWSSLRLESLGGCDYAQLHQHDSSGCLRWRSRCNRYDFVQPRRFPGLDSGSTADRSALRTSRR